MSKFFNQVTAHLAVWRLRKHPAFGAATRYIRRTVNDQALCPVIFSSPEVKERYVGQFIREVGEVLAAQNPVMANREKLACYVIGMARYQVLTLPAPDEPEEDVTGLRGRPGITGELKGHLSEIAEKDEEIKQLASGIDDPEQLYLACAARSSIYKFLANGFNCTRIALGDNHPSPQKDWYVPFVAAVCAYEEHCYRQAIGLTDVLATQDQGGSAAGLIYSTFVDTVMSGAHYPNLDWEKHFGHEHE